MTTALVGVQNGDTIYFYGADAEKAGPALKRKVLTRNIPGTLFYPFFSLPHRTECRNNPAASWQSRFLPLYGSVQTAARTMD